MVMHAGLHKNCMRLCCCSSAACLIMLVITDMNACACMHPCDVRTASSQRNARMLLAVWIAAWLMARSCMYGHPVLS